MKKVVSFLLSVLILLSLTGCGNEQIRTDSSVVEEVKETSTVEESLANEQPDSLYIQTVEVTENQDIDEPVVIEESKEVTENQKIDEPVVIEEPKEVEEPESYKVYFTITGIGEELYSSEVDFVEGSSVWSYTEDILVSCGASYETTGFSDFIYISSMFGLTERDYGPMSGWMYKVNGEDAEVGSGQYILSEGDVVEWYYSEG